MIKNIQELKDLLVNYKGEVIEKELQPVYDNRKSFYKKAIIKKVNIKNNTIYLLYSYNTLVCSICNYKYILNTEINESLLFSNTTLRHIKEFLKQYRYLFSENLKIESKKDIIKNNNYKERF